MTSEDEKKESEEETATDEGQEEIVLVRLLLKPWMAEKLRSFLQEHNAGYTDLFDLYMELHTVTDTFGITGNAEFKWKEGGIKAEETKEEISSPFLRVVEVDEPTVH